MNKCTPSQAIAETIILEKLPGRNKCTEPPLFPIIFTKE